ncbi:MAG: DMT family transporter [Candidatus Micrarchaeota archaeon]
MQSTQSKGILLAFLAALVSGISVFVNGAAVKLADPFVYTALKNFGALLFIGAIALLITGVRHFQGLSRRQWLHLAAIGVIGGSVPFLMFFWGLKLGGAAVSSFIFRSLFIFAGLFGYLLLKEMPEPKDAAAGVIMLAGNALLVSGELSFGLGQLMVLGATALWALEYTISRKVMADVHPQAVMASRMLFGSIILIGFLGATGASLALDQLSLEMLLWLGVSVAMLTGFMHAWYHSLRHIPVLKATAILALGGIVTASLGAAFGGALPSLTEAFGLLLLLVGAGVMVGSAQLIQALRHLKEPSPLIR